MLKSSKHAPCLLLWCLLLASLDLGSGCDGFGFNFVCAIWLSWVVYIVASNNYSYFCEKFDEDVKGLRWWFHRLIVLSRKDKFCLVTLYIVVLPWIPSRIEMVLFLIVNWIKSWITFIQFWSLTYVQFYNFAYELARYLVQVIILGLNQ